MTNFWKQYLAGSNKLKGVYESVVIKFSNLMTYYLGTFVPVMHVHLFTMALIGKACIQPSYMLISS